jgi:hypothetical protein
LFGAGEVFRRLPGGGAHGRHLWVEDHLSPAYGRARPPAKPCNYYLIGVLDKPLLLWYNQTALGPAHVL